MLSNKAIKTVRWSERVRIYDRDTHYLAYACIRFILFVRSKLKHISVSSVIGYELHG